MNTHPFDYLSILVSIIVALGVTELLSNFARYIRLRHEVSIYPPSIVWGISLFVLQVQIWWVSFYRRDIETWTFFGFALYLAIPVLIALLSHLVLNEIESGRDMEAEFKKSRTWFFGLFALAILISLIEDSIRSKSIRLDANLAFRCEFLLIAVLGSAMQRKSHQLVLSLAFLASLLAYITIVFGKL
jgi:hypothetical protein